MNAPKTKDTIQLIDFMPPCKVLGDPIQVNGCNRYQVSITDMTGSEKRMTLLEYGSSEDALRQFESAAATLHRLQEPGITNLAPKAWSFSNCTDGRYILIDVDSSQSYDPQAIAKEPMADRIAKLLPVLKNLEDLQKEGILPGQLRWQDILCDDPKNPRLWNMTDARIRAHRSSEEWEMDRRHIVSEAALLTYHTIIGSDIDRELVREHITPYLFLTLGNRISSDYLPSFCETLKNHFEKDASLDVLVELVDTILLCLNDSSVITSPQQASYLTIANFLEQNPLYPYVRNTSGMDKALRIVLYGGSAMCRTFLQAVIPAVQMLDTQLYIHIVVTDTQNFWKECKDAFPLLDQVVTVTHIPAVADSASVLSEKIVGTDRNGQRRPFAYLTIEAASQLPDLENDMVDCLFLLDSYNDTASAKICDLISRRDHPLLIGICRDQDKDGPEYEAVQAFAPIGSENPTRICTFTRNETRFPFESSRLYKKAYGIHTYWAKNYDEREVHQKTKTDFQDSYNRDSSIRTALSIPYKLYSCGIPEGEDASRRFYEEILHGSDQTMVRRLAWLEHRSWQAHLILNGWKLNPDDFDGGFDTEPFSQKNKDKKWHACRHGTNDNDTTLATWRPEDWDEASKDLSLLDPLDRISVEIHRGLADKVANHAADLKTCMDNLLGTLSPHLNHSVHTVIDQLIADVPNAALGWPRVSADLENKYPTDANVKKLGALAQELIQRNKRQAYKQIDLPLLDAIPYLQQDNPIRRIYKLYTDRAWDNIAASIFAEPVELILVPQKGHAVPDIKRYADFLKDERHMTTTVTAVTLETLEQMSQADANTVLDVTGADAAQILDAQRHSFLRMLPMIEYKNGGLDTPDGKYPNARYYSKDRSLTVEETMRINGATVTQDDIPMYSMHQYKELWEVVQLMGRSYARVSDYFNFMTRPCAITLDLDTLTINMPTSIANSYGYSTLLSDMEHEGIINPPTSNQIVVKHPDYYQDVKHVLEKVIDMIRIMPNPGSPFHVTPHSNPWEITNAGSTLAEIQQTYATSWHSPYSNHDATTNGLIKLLDQLKSYGVIDDHFNYCSTHQIAAIDPLFQPSLNHALDAYQTAISNGKQNFYKLIPQRGKPNALCALENCDLVFSCSHSVTLGGKIKYDPSNPKTYVHCDALALCLDKLQGQNLICQVGTTPIYNNSGSTFDIHFQFADFAVRDCLSKTGNALEALTYHTIRQMNCFDDVKLGVSFQWENQNVTGKDTTNEIDVICTKGMKSFFISCKQTYKLTNDYLTEIRYETDRFGLEGVPILVTTAQEQDNPYQYVRAKRMGIHIITLTKECYHSTNLQDGSKELEMQLTALLAKL